MIPRRIVLLHGFTQSGAIWVPVMERMTTRAPVEAPDLPGHGTASTTLASLVDSADDIAERFGNSAYVGYSMGGRVALHLALAHPSLVSHLVLCSTTAGIDDPDERAKRLSTDAALAGRIREIGLEVFLDEWRAQPMFANLARTTHDDDARMVNTVEGLAGSLGVMGTGTQQPLWSRLNELKMPVLIVTGNKDSKFDSLGRRLRDTIGDNAHHISVPDAGHAVPFERPAEFAAILDRFLR